MSSPHDTVSGQTESRLLRAFAEVQQELARLTATNQLLIQRIDQQDRILQRIKPETVLERRERLEPQAILECYSLAEDDLAGRARLQRREIANRIGVPESTLRSWPEFDKVFRQCRLSIKLRRETSLTVDQEEDNWGDNE